MADRKRTNSRDLLFKMYEAIIYSLTDGIEAVNADGKMMIYNDAQAMLEDFDAREVLNNSPKDIYELNDETSLLLRVLRSKEPIVNVRQCYTTSKGHKVDVVTSAIPLFSDERLIGSVSVTKDFTKIQQLIERNIEIEQKFSSGALRKSPGAAKKIGSTIHYVFGDIITKSKSMQ